MYLVADLLPDHPAFFIFVYTNSVVYLIFGHRNFDFRFILIPLCCIFDILARGRMFSTPNKNLSVQILFWYFFTRRVLFHHAYLRRRRYILFLYILFLFPKINRKPKSVISNIFRKLENLNRQFRPKSDRKSKIGYTQRQKIILFIAFCNGQQMAKTG